MATASLTTTPSLTRNRERSMRTMTTGRFLSLVKTSQKDTLRRSQSENQRNPFRRYRCLCQELARRTGRPSSRHSDRGALRHQ
eukprot:4394032-Amphidinium_carterae.1